MKTNKMMRAASALFVAVLLSTSCITTTFAKYTTQGSYQSSARVAKWGVVITTTGSLFDKTYLSGANGGTPGNGISDGEDNTVLSVESTEFVVAPGTKNEKGLTIKIEGKPEVDVDVRITASTTSGDVYLNGDDLPDLTTGQTTDTFSADRYLPVKFTLSKNGTVSEENKDITINQLIQKLNSLSKRYDAGTDLATAEGFGTYVITWKWDINGDDKADTLLGSLKTGTTELEGVTLKEGSQYNLSTDLKLNISVTQID